MYCLYIVFQFSDLILHPVLVMLQELTRRQEELYKLLQKKDREIEDYKDQGVTVSRS